MGFPWKKLGRGIATGVRVLAPFNPHVAMLDSLIEGVEASLPLAKGPDKKAAVVAMSDRILAELPMTDEQRAGILAARDGYIDAYVAARNAEAFAQQATDRLLAAVRSIKGGDTLMVESAGGVEENRR